MNEIKKSESFDPTESCDNKPSESIRKHTLTLETLLKEIYSNHKETIKCKFILFYVIWHQKKRLNCLSNFAVVLYLILVESQINPLLVTWNHITLCKQIIRRMSQMFCNILVVCKVQFISSRCFCQGHEGEEAHWTVRCWCHLILCYSLYGLEHDLKIHTWTYLIIEVLVTLVKFLEPSGYCTVNNCLFTFHTINVFGCFHNTMAQFTLIKHKFLSYTWLHVHLCGFQIPHKWKF